MATDEVILEGRFAICHRIKAGLHEDRSIVLPSDFDLCNSQKKTQSAVKMPQFRMKIVCSRNLQMFHEKTDLCRKMTRWACNFYKSQLFVLKKNFEKHLVTHAGLRSCSERGTGLRDKGPVDVCAKSNPVRVLQVKWAGIPLVSFHFIDCTTKLLSK